MVEMRNEATKAILSPFFSRQGSPSDLALMGELVSFTKVVAGAIKEVIECGKGPTLINEWPETGMLP